MQLTIYQSHRGEITIVPSCVMPGRDAIREFGRLFERGSFEASEDEAGFDFTDMLDRGYALVAPLELARIRRGRT